MPTNQTLSFAMDEIIHVENVLVEVTRRFAKSEIPINDKSMELLEEVRKAENLISSRIDEKQQQQNLQGAANANSNSGNGNCRLDSHNCFNQHGKIHCYNEWKCPPDSNLKGASGSGSNCSIIWDNNSGLRNLTRKFGLV